MTELVTTLRRADSLVDRLRAEATAPASSQVHLPVAESGSVPRQGSPEVGAARSWLVGRSVGVILLVLGTLCVLAAGVVFIAVAWMDLPLGIRALILIMLTLGFGLFSQMALGRGLQASAEAMAAIGCGMLVLDVPAGRRADLIGLADLPAAPYESLAGSLLVEIALGCAPLRRGRRGPCSQPGRP